MERLKELPLLIQSGLLLQYLTASQGHSKFGFQWILPSPEAQAKLT
jgi:hypothetical protein